jgi:hypothetical protein
MSEPIGMSITIGGILKASKIEEFLDTIQEDISDISEGPTTETDLRNDVGNPITWNGIAHYGLCNDVFAFCENNKLSYKHYCEAKSGYDAGTSFWKPGMKEARALTSNANADTLVRVEAIKPICDLLLSLAEQGKTALPLFIGHDEYMDTLVELGMSKSYKALLRKINKDLNDLLPTVERIPNFIIKG